jgi:N-sulfoglucosamine sulfohydrolase
MSFLLARYLSPRLLIAVISCVLSVAAHAAERPNILWITCEDMSPNLGCYGDTNAFSPYIDDFAKQSVRYTHAFSTAPVCSPSRACLISGMYATSLGNPQLRCERVLPPEVQAYSKYFRDVGYFTSNNVKTDYNVVNEAAFKAAAWNRCDNKAHWRQREPAQPFFSVFNLMETHQSRTSVWPWEEFEKLAKERLSPGERAHPEEMKLPKFYPDTKLARRTLARYYDCIRIMDKEVGDILRELEADGLAEDTIVFFYADHGMGLPRGKRVLQNSGLQVPLIIRFPKKWAHLAPAKAGGTVDRMVSFVDFPPTVLSLAGLPIPEYMQGVPFLGPKNGPDRKFIYGARDRVDEAFDTARSINDGHWLYIRNYHPHLPWGQPEGYSDASDFRREFLQMGKEGKLKPGVVEYVIPRPPEELYDLTKDAQQQVNLAGQKKHAAQLERLRGELHKWILETRDLGFIPEQQLVQQTDGVAPREWSALKDHYELENILSTAELVGRPGEVKELAQRLANDNETVRWWAVVGLRAAGKAALTQRSLLLDSLEDVSSMVRIEAATLLVEQDDAATKKALGVLGAALIDQDLNTALYAARQLQLLGEKAKPMQPLMAKVREQAKTWTNKDMALYVGFALDAALNEFKR